jgi:hypothetical protein
MSRRFSERICRYCRYFDNRPAALEAAFPGLRSMGSGYGSTRGDDGLCARYDRYLGAESSCRSFEPLEPPTVDAAATSLHAHRQ